MKCKIIFTDGRQLIVEDIAPIFDLEEGAISFINKNMEASIFEDLDGERFTEFDIKEVSQVTWTNS